MILRRRAVKVINEQFEQEDMNATLKGLNKQVLKQTVMPEIKHAYQNNSIHQPTITSLQQKQALASFGGGIFSQEHGAYRYQDEHNVQTNGIHQQSFAGWDLQM